MNRLQRWPYAIAMSLLAHVGLIPLLAIYGVHICPVLRDQGFSFGCKFNSAYVALSLTASFIFNCGVFYVLYQNTVRLENARKFFKLTLRDFSWISGFIHFTVFICGLFFLLDYLEQFNLPGPTTIRMTAAFAISTIFLAILQSECLDWAMQFWLRTDEQWATLTTTAAESKDPKSNIYTRWSASLLSRNAPFWAGIFVVIIYGYSKILEIRELYDVDDGFFNARIVEVLQILALALGWIFFVDLMKFRKEADLVKDVQVHVENLAKGETGFYSREVAAGIWQELFQVLNRATHALAQRSRLMRGLSAYAASQVVDKVLHKDELDTFGQRKTIAILMSDLRGFTQLSNVLEPEVVVNILNLYFEAMINVCADHNLIVDKFIGDGLLAYADPEVGDDVSQCQRAVRTANGMLTALAKLNEKIIALGHTPLQIGIGLHFGDVIVGSIGSKDRLQHTIIGDAVNTAARLEAKCKELQAIVVASKTVVSKAGPTDFLALAHYGSVEIRGVALPIEVYTVPNTYTPGQEEKVA
jgi:class 3 adenylate cyclase